MVFAVAGIVAIGLGVVGVVAVAGVLGFIICQNSVWVKSEEAMDSDRNWQ